MNKDALALWRLDLLLLFAMRPRFCGQDRLALPQRMLFSLVLPPGGQAAPYVPLGLVFLQHLLHLQIQRPVIGRQPLGQVLMHRGLADAEFPRAARTVARFSIR